MSSLPPELSDFGATVRSLLETSSTKHLSAVTTGAFPDGVAAGVFQGGLVGPGKPPIKIDERVLQRAYTTEFEAAEAKGEPLRLLSARANRANDQSAWEIRVHPLSEADAVRCDAARTVVDARVQRALVARTKEPGFNPGWERLSLTRYRGQVRFIRKYPDAKPEDLSVDAEMEDCLRAADAAYAPFGIRPDYPRWHLRANGQFEVEMSLEPA